MRTTAMKERMGLSLSDAPVTITPQLLEQFLDGLKVSGRQKRTICAYQHSIEEFYDFLPPDKEIRPDTLKEWKDHLKASGYSDSTINIRMTSVNGLLRFCGRDELVSNHERITSYEPMPEMSRAEFLQFLSAVREISTEKYYLLIKVFADVDVSIGELEYLTVEAAQEGIVCMPNGKNAAIPRCLKEELLEYVKHQRIRKGPIFVTRNGTLMDRSNIANSIHRLAVKAGMEPEKCCPSALHRVYLTTQEELMNLVHPTLTQYYENLIDSEQVAVGWNR